MVAKTYRILFVLHSDWKFSINESFANDYSFGFEQNFYQVFKNTRKHGQKQFQRFEHGWSIVIHRGCVCVLSLTLAGPECL